MHAAAWFSVAFLLPALGLPAGECTNHLLSMVEKAYHAKTPQGVAEKILGAVQRKCRAGQCPQVKVGGCSSQPVDDLKCDMPNVFSTSVKLGTDEICKAGCDAWPCKAACDGIDVDICKSADYILCKTGCIGISSCVDKCESAIVNPCKRKLVDECSDKCESAFSACKSSCQKGLTMKISADFERMQGIVTSMRVARFDLNCTEIGIGLPFRFGAKLEVAIDSASLDLRIRAVDAGISSTSALALRKITMGLALPLIGAVDCATESQTVSVTLGAASVTDFNLDVDLQLDKTLSTIASVICFNLPFCKDAIKDSISTGIKGQILKHVPNQVAHEITILLRELVKNLKCPDPAVMLSTAEAEVLYP